MCHLSLTAECELCCVAACLYVCMCVCLCTVLSHLLQDNWWFPFHASCSNTSTNQTDRTCGKSWAMKARSRVHSYLECAPVPPARAPAHYCTSASEDVCRYNQVLVGAWGKNRVGTVKVLWFCPWPESICHVSFSNCRHDGCKAPILPIAATNQLNQLAALLLHWVVDHPVVTNLMSFLSVSPQLPNASHLINTNF